MPVQSYIADLLRSSILIVTALFPIVNSLGNSPIFLGLARDYLGPDQAHTGQNIGPDGLILLHGPVLARTPVLALFGISIPVVQVGGGLLVIATGWNMLNRKDKAVPAARREPQD